jgi:hypothetical protein
MLDFRMSILRRSHFVTLFLDPFQPRSLVVVQSGTNECQGITGASVLTGVLCVTVFLGDVSGSGSSNAAPTIEDDLLVRPRFLESKLFLELCRLHMERTGKHGERDIDG